MSVAPTWNCRSVAKAMPAALWKSAEPSSACAVKAPARPIARVPCSKIPNPAGHAGAAARIAAAVMAIAHCRPLIMPKTSLDRFVELATSP